MRVEGSKVGRIEVEGDQGFTLLELLVVIAILGLTVGLVLARGPLRSAGLDARAEANTIAGALRLARSQAIATDRAIIVRLDPAAHALRIGDALPRALPPGVALAAPADGISFAPDGSSSGGRIALATGPVRIEVAVDWLTGRVSVAPAGAPVAQNAP